MFIHRIDSQKYNTTKMGTKTNHSFTDIMIIIYPHIASQMHRYTANTVKYPIHWFKDTNKPFNFWVNSPYSI